MDGAFGHLQTAVTDEKVILATEKTTSGGRCGVFFAAFLRSAPACPDDRGSQGAFLSLAQISTGRSAKDRALCLCAR